MPLIALGCGLECGSCTAVCVHHTGTAGEHRQCNLRVADSSSRLCSVPWLLFIHGICSCESVCVFVRVRVRNVCVHVCFIFGKMRLYVRLCCDYVVPSPEWVYFAVLRPSVMTYCNASLVAIPSPELCHEICTI